jgi:hypothetical protein
LGEGHCAKVLFAHPGKDQRIMHHRNDVLLVRTAGQLGYHATPGLVYLLSGYAVRAYYAVDQHRSGRLVTGTFDTKYHDWFPGGHGTGATFDRLGAILAWNATKLRSN